MLLHSLSEVVDAADRTSCCCDCAQRIERPFSWEGEAVPRMGDGAYSRGFDRPIWWPMHMQLMYRMHGFAA